MLRQILTLEKQILLFPKTQTFDGIALNKAERSSLPSTSDVPDGLEFMSTETREIFSSTELNQFEISSDDDESSHGAARSRPVRAVAKRRKTKVVVAKAKGRKQQIEEMDDVFIE